MAAKWWPLSARLAISLMRHGCRVSALCPQRHPLTHIRGLERIERYRGTRSLPCLSRALRDLRPEMVIPCDDGVVAQLHALHAQDPTLRPLIERSLGDARSFAITASRYRLLETAGELGIPVPETRRVVSDTDLVSWHEQVAPEAALKIDGECGGNGVRICGSLAESLKAFRELSVPLPRAAAWKRLIVNRDPLALWAQRHRGPLDVTVQRVIRGRPANAMLACREGEILSLVSVAVLATDGPTGAATVVRRIDNPSMERAAVQLAARLHLTGFCGLDFMIETDSETAFLIEMNPRCTQLGHLRFGGAPSLAGAFAASLGGELYDAGDPVPLDTIGLYPQALNALKEPSRAACGSYLDVPWDEPQLIAELKKDSWPERRWLSRLYHTVKPAVSSRWVEYGNPIQDPVPLTVPKLAAGAGGVIARRSILSGRIER
ncbi:MAG TPA: ATP-grasp domain-containing protein [Steroidobacteraceae bacterium]|nr:ATP-grasp domain-containing protein [Steroidobacteraceae bacterium]